MEQNTSSEDIVIDEFASIIDGDSTTVNASAFQRYAVPPQFDGNSSEEENVPQVEEKEIESIEESVDGHDEEQPGAGYAPLVADEFGEFVSSEDFGDFYTPDRVGYLQETTATSSENNEKPVSNTLNDTAVVSTRVSIAPLDAGKIQAIKAAMSKITIKQPNSGAVLLADALELKRLRLGDELTV